MSTERTHSTSTRPPAKRRGRLLGAVAISAVSLVGVVAPASTAGAQTAPAEAPTARNAGPATGTGDAARLVARRRAAEHRRQSEIVKEREAAVASFLDALATAGRTGAVIDKGTTALGRPYVRGAAGPGAFDCSGFTRWAWQAAGVDLPHYTGAQWAQTDHIALGDLQPGDIVFFWGRGERGDPSHVGLYVGDGQMIHAPGTGRSVRYDSIGYWTGARVAAGRVR